MLKGSKIKMYRVHHHIKVSTMADSLTIHPDHLSKIENGYQTVSIRIEKDFFKIYESTFDEFDKEIFKERYPYDNIKLDGKKLIIPKGKTLKKMLS